MKAKPKKSRSLSLIRGSAREIYFKIGKVCLHMMMKDSADEVIQKAYPKIKSGKRQRVAYESATSLASVKQIELGWVAQVTVYSLK